MSQHAYIHGTEATEQERLSALNRMTNRAFLKFLDVRPGMRVLDVGSGLGILAAEVAAAAPDVQVTGVERSEDQLRAAVKHPRVTLVQGDAQDLKFPDGAFDLVYTRYVLEHVPDPERVAREMRRVARSGARVAFCENDSLLMRVDPPCPAFDDVWARFCAYQGTLGGDALIGRRLFSLLRRAGFTSIELSVQPEVHWFGSPGFYGWVDNLIGNIDSARKGMVATGASTEPQIARAIEELRGLLSNDQASALFTWNRAMAVR